MERGLLGILRIRPPVNTPSTKQAVSVGPATALVISNMIGTGVFTSLGFQISAFNAPGSPHLTESVFPLIMLWVVGGVLALCGALCYAELATALPRSGGEYNFLSRIYHPVVGFCTGLCAATVGFAAPTAISALTFGRYLCACFPALNQIIPFAPESVLAFFLVTLVTACHLRSVRFTGGFQAVATAISVLLLLTFIGVGFADTTPQPVTFLPHTPDWALLLTNAFGSSLIFVMYSYSGWNAAAYIVEEVQDPARALPRALILGTTFVLLLYVAVNAVFLYTTPLATLAGQAQVADFAGKEIFGPVGARVASGLICVGLVANVSSMVWIGSRVSEAIGGTYPDLAFLGKTTVTRVPYIALLCQYGIICVMLPFKPDNIINYVETVLAFWSLLAVLGVIVLRFREPDLPRPYRTVGYPVTPILFALIASFGLIQTYQSHPNESLIGAGTLLVGIPLYFWVSRNVSTERLRRRDVVPDAA